MKDRSRDTEERRLEVAAAATRIPPSRVRHFVRVGLLRPSRVEGRVSFFGEAQMAQLRRIRRLRDDLGLNIAGIEVALRLLDEIESLRRELATADGGGVVISQRLRKGRAPGRDRGGSSGRL